jgi:serpin B
MRLAFLLSIALLAAVVTILLSVPQNPPPAPAGADRIAAAVNQTGLDLLYARTAESGRGNLLLSPYSVAAAMIMTYAGADGATRDEMRRVLHLPEDDSATFAALQELDRHLRGARVELSVANRLFAQNGFALQPAFLALLRDRFAAPAKQLDFATEPDRARASINDWVARETRGRIRDVVPPGSLSSDTRVVVANATYLKAPWKYHFEPQETEVEPFRVSGTLRVDVPMMRVEEMLRYEVHRGFAALALPYDGGDLQFLILLPDRVDGLPELERRVTPELLASCTRMEARDLRLRLPRFRLEPASLPLGQLLRRLGMSSAFDRPAGSANFERMAPRQRDAYLFLSEVFHQAWLSVDEAGTEAAAVTATGVTVMSVATSPTNPIEVRVDRPFLFAIQHIPSGMSLFLGRVTDPR